jgi:hypothetical protein
MLFVLSVKALTQEIHEVPKRYEPPTERSKKDHATGSVDESRGHVRSGSVTDTRTIAPNTQEAKISSAETRPSEPAWERPEITRGVSSLSSFFGDVWNLRQFQVDRSKKVRESPLDSSKVSIICLEKSGREAIQGKPNLSTRLIKSEINDTSAFRNEIYFHRNELIIVLGHIDDAEKTIGGLPIKELKKDTNILWLGCDSSTYFRSGVTGAFYILDAIDALNRAMTQGSVETFMSTLTSGLKLKIEFDQRILEIIKDTLTWRLVDTNEGRTRFTISLSGPIVRQAGTAPIGTLSIICLELGIPYPLASSVISSLTLTLVLMAVGTSLPGLESKKKKLLFAIRIVGSGAISTLGRLSVGLLYLLYILFAVSLIPVIIGGLILFGLLDLVESATVRTAKRDYYAWLRMAPARVQIAMGFVTIWLIGTAIGTIILN